VREGPLQVREDGPIAVLTIADPATRNALTNELLAELADRLERLDRGGATAAVITGGSEMFVSGADLRAMLSIEPAQYAGSPRGEAWRRLNALELPLVAAVAGHALGGGCELAFLADLVVAADTARFGQPEVRLGLIPGAGGTQRWARAAGRFVAANVVLAGSTVDAFEARDLGLVASVVPAERVVPAAVALASELARAAPVAIRAARTAVRAAEQTGLDAGLAAEREQFLRALATDDRREGIAAFLEKRPPAFTGR
jgi:enoyl-CoA hydratase